MTTGIVQVPHGPMTSVPLPRERFADFEHSYRDESFDEVGPCG